MGKLSDTAPAGSSATTTAAKAPTSEQLRIAQLLADKSDEHSITKDKVNKVIELTHCNESAAVAALYDCDNDIGLAVDKILEGGQQGEWIVREGKKAKKVQQHQYSAKDSSDALDNHDDAENVYGGKSTGGRHPRGASSNAGALSGDQPPRFRGRGGTSARGQRRFDKENESSEYAGDRGGMSDRGRPRGRGRGGRENGDRGRGRGFAGRGGRRGGNIGTREGDGGGFDQIDRWNSNDTENNTWDNSMANTLNVADAGGGQQQRGGEWKPKSNNNTWDNSMVQQQTAAPSVANNTHSTSNEWNEAEDWGGEADLAKMQLREGIVIESSGARKMVAPSAGPIAISATGTPQTISTSHASATAVAHGGGVRGESINVNVLFANQQPANRNTSSPGTWANKEASAELKHKLGIGQVSAPSHPDTASHLRPRDAIPSKMTASKVELPSSSAAITGPIDVQFGDMLMSESQPLFDFGAPTGYKPQQNPVASQANDQSLRQQHQQVFQRAPKKEQVNGGDLLANAGDVPSKVDITPSPYSGASAGYGGASSDHQHQHQQQQHQQQHQHQHQLQQQQTQQQQAQYASRAAPVSQQLGTTTPQKNTNSGLSSLSGNHQRALLGGTNNSGLPVQTSVGDSAVQQLAKDVSLGQVPISLHGGPLAQGNAGNNANMGVLSSVHQSRSPAATTATSKQQVTSSLNVNQMASYQQLAGLNPYLGMSGMSPYDQYNLNSMSYMPAQNLFLNQTGGFDMRALQQLPPMAGTNVVTGRDADLKAQLMRQDNSGSTLSAQTGAANIGNLNVPPPGLPGPSVSNAQEAAHLLSMASLYQMPLFNTPYALQPQFLVPSVSSSSTGSTANQYARTNAYGQPTFNMGAYAEDLQLSSQDYNKSNYNVMTSGGQPKTVSSVGGGGISLGGSDVNNKYGGGLKGAYDTKSYVQTAAATPPPIGNMNFPAAFQASAAAPQSYGYAGYIPQHMMGTQMATAQLSNDLLSGGAANQRGVAQNQKSGGNAMNKGPNQYAYGSWGN